MEQPTETSTETNPSSPSSQTDSRPSISYDELEYYLKAHPDAKVTVGWPETVPHGPNPYAEKLRELQAKK